MYMLNVISVLFLFLIDDKLLKRSRNEECRH